ncbi:M15 family metallopeptidase [Ruminococcus albus]|uniref:D-alanyl-D-alanine carboxypeptidase n=1 Tax=Ruminococcus albus TaxID=1264 RepID=A0A1H7K848_RUMAL|nr:M15 family metallopeptidase [Ruminococcus albus]SEK82117.1 D-alanyl-D-alanine carboxypeptidase [Ruminococcus albus]
MIENDNRNVPEEERAVKGLESIIDNYDLSRYELSPEEKAREEMIRQRIRDRRRAAERRRIKRNRTLALIVAVVLVFILCRGCYASYRKKRDEKQAKAKATESKVVKPTVHEEDTDSSQDEQQPEVGHKIQNVDGLTYVDGILIVNKTYPLPRDYAPGISTAAQAAFDDMTAAAFNDGLYLYVNSGYRSYDEQYMLYYNYALSRGVAEADRVSSRPGHSEHQSGLCFDVNSTDFSFSDTAEARWLAAHCADYGFIIRFPKGKEAITGYEYESWHIRYVGVDIAKEITSKGLCLEEYLGVTSNYDDSPDGVSQQQLAEEMGVTVDDPNGGTETDAESEDSAYYDEGYESQVQ